MTYETPNHQDEVLASLAALGERLIYLKQRARHCRRVAQSCENLAVAATLNEMAARYEAEAMLSAPSEGQP
jgi:hypothetical protein